MSAVVVESRRERGHTTGVAAAGPRRRRRCRLWLLWFCELCHAQSRLQRSSLTLCMLATNYASRSAERWPGVHTGRVIVAHGDGRDKIG
jgi:hypothetical protein